jgi:hypothetical protein
MQYESRATTIEDKDWNWRGGKNYSVEYLRAFAVWEYCREIKEIREAILRMRDLKVNRMHSDNTEFPDRIDSHQHPALLKDGGKGDGMKLLNSIVPVRNELQGCLMGLLNWDFLIDDHDFPDKAFPNAKVSTKPECFAKLTQRAEANQTNKSGWRGDSFLQPLGKFTGIGKHEKAILHFRSDARNSYHTEELDGVWQTALVVGVNDGKWYNLRKGQIQKYLDEHACCGLDRPVESVTEHGILLMRATVVQHKDGGAQLELPVKNDAITASTQLWWAPWPTAVDPATDAEQNEMNEAERERQSFLLQQRALVKQYEFDYYEDAGFDDDNSVFDKILGINTTIADETIKLQSAAAWNGWWTDRTFWRALTENSPFHLPDRDCVIRGLQSLASLRLSRFDTDNYFGDLTPVSKLEGGHNGNPIYPLKGKQCDIIKNCAYVKEFAKQLLPGLATRKITFLAEELDMVLKNSSEPII